MAELGRCRVQGCGNAGCGQGDASPSQAVCMSSGPTAGCTSGVCSAAHCAVAHCASLCVRGQDAICGARVIDHTAIAAHLFQEEAEFGSRGEAPQQQMRQLLQLWSQQELQLFLAFTTGVANLQPNGSMINADATPKHKIKLQRCLCSACKPKQQSPDLVCCNLPVRQARSNGMLSYGVAAGCQHMFLDSQTSQLFIC